MAHSKPKILFLVTFALAVASLAYFSWLTGRLVRAEASGAATLFSAVPYVSHAADAVIEQPTVWEAPPPQSRGREWIYDAFSPPEIYYDARSRQFTVTPPAVEAVAANLATEEQPFEVEVISVQPERFRLQLIGYVGGEGDWRGTFENTLTGEIFLAAAGRRVPALDLVITQLEVRHEIVELSDSLATRQRIAAAVVHDERDDLDFTLTHHERCFTDDAFAMLMVAEDPAPRRVRPGDTFAVGAFHYHVDAIRLAPPAVEITKEMSEPGRPEHRTLTPRFDSAALEYRPEVERVEANARFDVGASFDDGRGPATSTGPDGRAGRRPATSPQGFAAELARGGQHAPPLKTLFAVRTDFQR